MSKTMIKESMQVGEDDNTTFYTQGSVGEDDFQSFIGQEEKENTIETQEKGCCKICFNFSEDKQVFTLKCCEESYCQECLISYIQEQVEQN